MAGLQRFLAIAAAIALGLLAAGTASTIHAGEPSGQPSWRGIYAGVQVGVSRTRARSSAASDDAFDEGSDRPSVVVTGTHLLVGGQIGMNFQSQNLVFGAEMEGGRLGGHDDKFIVRSPDNFARVNMRGYGALTARAGYAVARLLPYVKAGFAFASISNEAGDLIDGSDAVDQDDRTRKSRVRPGFAVGGGLECPVARNWSVRTEYLYLDFGSDKSRNSDGESFKHANNAHTIKFALNYRFTGFPW